MGSRSVVTVLIVAVVVGLAVLLAAGGAYWWLRAQPLGPLAAEALILPEDAAFVAGVDVKRITSGANYKKYMSGQMAEAGAGLKELEAKTGVNAERDVDQLFVAGGGKSGQQSAVVLMLGRFDADKVSKAAKAEAKADIPTKTVEGVTVYVVQAGPDGAECALPKPGLLLFGTPSLVEATLANQAKGKKAMISNPQVSAALKAIAGNPAIWFVAGQSLMDALPKTGGPKIPIPRSLTFTGDVDPSVALQLSGDMADEAEAKNLADALNGFKAMAGMFAADKPEVQEAAAALGIKAEAKKVTLSLQLTAAMLDKLQASAKKARFAANESAAVGDIRTVISSQAAYQSTFENYGELRCLAQPKTCNPSAEFATPFLDVALAELKEKNGYSRSFYPGGRSGEGFNAYAYMAVPVKVGETGQRSFCGDDTGVICQNEAGVPFQVAAGRCPQGCQLVR